MANFRSTEGPRPASSRGTQKPSGSSSISEVLGDLAHRGHKKSSSFSSRRLSEVSTRRSEDVAADAPAATNRWSSSTTSSAGIGHHRKNGSFSKRFSFGSSLNSGFRSLSPSKRRPPVDAHNDIPQAQEAASTPLPNPSRLSPLTLPNLAEGLGSDSRVESDLHGSSYGGDGTSDSPPRRPKEASHKPGSHLSDIIESDKGQQLANQQRPAPGSSASNVQTNRDRRAPGRASTSRDPSPVKQTASAPLTSASSSPVRKRSKRDKDKKVMLSKALKRANEAVHLDNVQDFDQAIWAYEEACSLLDAVLARTSTESERQKLTSIRETYSLRVQDLRQIQAQTQDEALDSVSARSSTDFDIRQSLEQALDTGNRIVASTVTPVLSPVSPGEQEPQNSREESNLFSMQAVSHQASRPNPLSPRLQVRDKQDASTPTTATKATFAQRESGVVGQHNGKAMRDTGSWFLGAADGNVGDDPSPRHSMDSSEGIRRRNIRTEADDTEAEFDAALEAAIESAYDDGYEPSSAREYDSSLGIPPIAPLQTRDPIAEQTRSYALRHANIQRLSQRSRSQLDPDFSIDFSDGGSVIDSDEEDQLLDAGRDVNPVQPTQALDTTALSPTSLPRQSNSSEVSNHTWGSSVASSVNTGATSLGTVDEHVSLPPVVETEDPEPDLSPQKPVVPRQVEASPTRDLKRDILGANARGESPLRDRRFSGNSKARSLRIETQVPSRRPSDTSNELGQSQNHVHDTAKLAPVQADPAPLPAVRGPSRLDPGGLACPYPSPNIAAFQTGTFTPTTPSFPQPSGDSSNTSPTTALQATAKPDRPHLQQNVSSLSLSKQAQLGIRTPDGTDPSPDTPLSFGFSSILTPPERQDSRLGNPLSTPMDPTFGSLPTSTSVRMAIFDHEFHSITLPGSPNPELQNGPRPLEPCPDSVLLRPYWLLRCVQQTLTHPKGGYITTRLFVPHEAWNVKTAKLKNIEEKIANIDLLTAALLKLSAVDTEDADAVLDEMQSLENVLDQAQSNLSKRLGSEVGVSGAQNLFKEAPTATSPTAGDSGAGDNAREGNTTSTGGKTSSKGYLNSWRKLRNKSSSTNLSSGYSTKDNAREQITTMASVPMTVNNDVLIRNRNKMMQSMRPVDLVSSSGANANYVSALAKLCDATAVLDQISRQAEDPGLKFTTQTHVGLELSARHAAEFFGFYLCRFVLQDLLLLSEKYVKRSTEWVMS